MGQFEVDAKDQLLRRRRSLHRQAGLALAADPAARWLDYEATETAVAEPVRRELSEIDAALKRITEGRFGTCQSCGGPMGLQRLRAIPEARYCTGCSGQGLLMEAE
jgi:RNA polymerase-binding transcription factor DksA